MQICTKKRLALAHVAAALFSISTFLQHQAGSVPLVRQDFDTSLNFAPDYSLFRLQDIVYLEVMHLLQPTLTSHRPMHLWTELWTKLLLNQSNSGWQINIQTMTLSLTGPLASLTLPANSRTVEPQWSSNH